MATAELDMEQFSYPRGRHKRVANTSAEQRQAWIEEMKAMPAALRAALKGLSDSQLDTPYRPNGWTIRQVVHHVPDSHANGYIRFCFALHEDCPTIMPYDQDAWATSRYARTAPVDTSLDMLAATQARWCTMFEQLEPAQWERTFNHPENGLTTLDQQLQLYAWHSRHHLAHVTEARRRHGW